MAMNFPDSPTTGQTFSVSGGPTYSYDGSKWRVLTPGNQFARTTVTATAGQTSFSVVYTVGAIDVFLNGVKLVSGSDFTATTGTTIVLTNGANAGDTLEVVSYSQITYTAVSLTSNVTGTLPVANGGTGTDTAFTAGSVVFAGASGVYSQKNSNLFWDNTNNRLGIGTASPSYKLDVNGTTRIINDVTINTGRTISGGTGGAVLSSTGINNDIVMNGRSAAITGGWAGLRIHQVANLDGLALVGDTSQTAAYLRVETGAGAGVMTLDASGNLGVGTTSPYSKLSVVNTSPSSGINQILTLGNDYNASGLNEPTIRFDNNFPSAYAGWTIGAQVAGGSYFRICQFTGTTPTLNEALRIDQSGNLLVGTTNSTAAGKIRAKYTPTSQWGFDASESTVTVANGSNATLPVGSGLIIITGQNATGSTGVYALGGGATARIAASDGVFVAATTTPGAGEVSIAWDGTNYRIYNNQGNQITFGVCSLRTRNNN